MNNTPDESPRLVTCRCHYCEGEIEFDASGFNEGENCTLTCPHCQTETTVTIPPPAPAPPTPPPTLAEIQKLKVAQIKNSLRTRLESGKPVFLFDSVFLPVDSEILDKQFASEFDVSILRRLGTGRKSSWIGPPGNLLAVIKSWFLAMPSRRLSQSVMLGATTRSSTSTPTMACP